jgi:hypothetical protein
MEVGHLYIYIKKNKGPKIDFWGTPCFNVSHFEENFTKDFQFFLFYLSDSI